MSRKLVSKYQFVNQKEPADAVSQTVLNYFSQNPIITDYLKKQWANSDAESQGKEVHKITSEMPDYFYNAGSLNIRGDQLLKQSGIYTSRGLINPQGVIDPSKYYTQSQNGLIDADHYINYGPEDTYTPLTDSARRMIVPHIFDNNQTYGAWLESQKGGQVTQAKDKKQSYPEHIGGAFLGGSPGLDNLLFAQMQNPNLSDHYLDAVGGQTIFQRAATNTLTYPGLVANSPFMIESGYNRLKDAEHWYDYPLGVGEITLGTLPFIYPTYRGYQTVRGLLQPKYALAQAIKEAPLNVEMLNSYSRPFAPSKPLLSDYKAYEGGHSFEYQPEHMHGIDVNDLAMILAKHGYFNKPAPGRFIIHAKLPEGKQVKLSQVETQPSGYPVQVSTNPERPHGHWGRRPGRDYPERIISSNDVNESANSVVVAGVVGQDGRIQIFSIYPEMKNDITTKSFPWLFTQLNSENPPFEIGGQINKARAFWDTHAIVDDTDMPARDPFKRGAKKTYVAYDRDNVKPLPMGTSYKSIWESGKKQATEYILSSEHKDRVMNHLNLTEQQADAYIQQELRNLENVELVNMGKYKVGQPFEETLAYSVGPGKWSGSNMFSHIQENDSWMPQLWTEEQYRNFLQSYPDHARAYDLARNGVTQVKMTEGLDPVKANAGFEGAIHATTRGDIDPVLQKGIKHNRQLAASLLGQSPGMLSAEEARVVGVELDRAWKAIQGYLPEHYRTKPLSVQKRDFFYDVLRASDDGGESFYKAVPEWWKQRFDPTYNYILNKGTNGLDPDEALYNFWEEFVQNQYPNSNLNDIT